MSSRRRFLQMSALGAGMVLTRFNPAAARQVGALDEPEPLLFNPENAPLVLATWNHGMPANAGAWEILGTGGRALDAVEKGVMVTESDPNNRSVGLGGLPDREGEVSLDACIMNEFGKCGAVAFLQNIEHPIAVARKVMEDTPHVMLVGEGAYAFAIAKGFPRKEYHTEAQKAAVRKAYEEWLKKQEYKPMMNRENHDTIGMIALDAKGNLSGACTTSGLAWKMHGRVGDSPIIGAGLFVDNEVGAAVATGVGEAVIRVAGTHAVVEMMRLGHSPERACQLAVQRIVKVHGDAIKDIQVGFLAINKAGEYGGFAVHEGFEYAVRTHKLNEMVKSKHELTK